MSPSRINPANLLKFGDVCSSVVCSLILLGRSIRDYVNLARFPSQTSSIIFPVFFLWQVMFFIDVFDSSEMLGGAAFVPITSPKRCSAVSWFVRHWWSSLKKQKQKKKNFIFSRRCWYWRTAIARRKRFNNNCWYPTLTHYQLASASHPYVWLKQTKLYRNDLNGDPVLVSSIVWWVVFLWRFLNSVGLFFFQVYIIYYDL